MVQFELKETARIAATWCTTQCTTIIEWTTLSTLLQKEKPTNAPWIMPTHQRLFNKSIGPQNFFFFFSVIIWPQFCCEKDCVSWTFSNTSVQPIKYIKACSFSDFNLLLFLGLGQRHLTHALILNYGLSKKHKLMHFSPGLLWALWKLNPSFYMTPV